MPPSALPGFRDFFPAELAERAHIMAAWREVARRFAFVEYDGPPLEPLELYTKKSGAEIVGQLYNFIDKGGREVALRPEMTPTLARMVASRANALRKPVRWFSVPQLFRYERQQRGRLREHFQLNMDIIGEADVTADAELLAAAIDVMRVLGLGPGDVRARVSDRRLLNSLLRLVGITVEQLPAVYAVVDKMEREPREVQEKKLADAGIDEISSRRLLEVLKARGLDELREQFGDAPELREDFTRLARYFEFLGALGVREWVEFDLSIVRGLAYYTGIVFELFDAKGELRAICGGGRYDSLLQSLGGVDLPALGFGMGDVVLGELLRQRALMPEAPRPLDYWIAGADASQAVNVMRIAGEIRARKGSAEYALREQALTRQFKTAATVGAREIIIVRGPTDITVRTLSDGNERQTDLNDFLRQMDQANV